MRSRAQGSIGLSAVSLLAFFACRPTGSNDRGPGAPSSSVSASSPAAGSGDEVVATIGGAVVRARDVAAQMRRFAIDARRAADDLVTFEVLARAAADSGVVLDPGDDDALDAIRVQRLIEREIEPHIAWSAIPEAEVRALYDRGKKRFVHGRLVEVAVLCVFTGARMKPERRAAAKEIAQQLKAFVDGRPARTAGDFAEIANDPVWVARNVSQTTVLQAEDEPFPAVVGRAVQTLSKPGDTTDLIGDETGYYLARYISERPPENTTFVAAEPGLRQQMYEPWRRQKFLHLSIDMSVDHVVQIYPENFPLLAVEHSSIEAR